MSSSPSLKKRRKLERSVFKAEPCWVVFPSLLRLFKLPSADDAIWIILLAKIPVDGCLHHTKRVRFVFGTVLFPHFNVEFCQNLVQCLRAVSLNLFVNISHFTPFHPYCQPCLRGSLGVFACSRLIYLCYFFGRHDWETGLFQSKWCC